ncbi:hypothetical protein AB832_07525 [Flavobacteriaceae bacterium (ex Bugula neritina AB1)]|nr:hypothetical protein AB832_07525 [Flavobacteriaceae bacterium (ex Bugula neritina AB1)]
MAKYLQNSFLSGVVRDDLIALSCNQDSIIYKTGAKALWNSDVKYPIGVSRRGGFKHLHDTKLIEGKNTLLIHFSAVDGEYILILHDSGLIVYSYDNEKKEVKLVETITEYTRFERDVKGYVVLKTITKTLKTEGDWNPDLNNAPNPATVNFKTQEATIDTTNKAFPYNNDDIPNIQYAKTKRSIYMVDGKHYPTKITHSYDPKTKKSSFVFGEMYIVNNESALYLENIRNFKFSYKFVREYQGQHNKTVWVKEAATALPSRDNTPYKVERLLYFDDNYDNNEKLGNDKINSPFNMYIGKKHVGFPKIVEVFDNRLIFANTELYPNCIWCSIRDVIDDDDSYNNFTMADDENSGIEKALSIGSGEIISLVSANVLQIFTTSGIFTSNTLQLSPTIDGFTIRKQTDNLIDIKIKPIYTNGRTIYLKGEILSYMVGEYDKNKSTMLFHTQTLSQYSIEIINPIKMVYRQSKKSKNTDQLFILTKNRINAYNVIHTRVNDQLTTNVALNQWESIRGRYDKTDKRTTNIKDIYCNDDNLFILVERNNTLRLEQLDEECLVDGCVYGETETDLVGKLDHLEGQDVNVVYDYSYAIKDKVISGKLVNFSNKIPELEQKEIKNIQVGFPYYFSFTSLPVRMVTQEQNFNLFRKDIKMIKHSFYFDDFSRNAEIHIKQGSQTFTTPLIVDPDPLKKSYIVCIKNIYTAPAYSIVQTAPLNLSIGAIEIDIASKTNV